MPDLKKLYRELSLSDEEFKKSYIQENEKWWSDFFGFHKRIAGAVLCANCEEKISSPKKLRPLSGKNYCEPCFAKVGLEDVQHNLNYSTPSNILYTEWILKVARVMDRGLVRLALTDEDLKED